MPAPLARGAIAPEPLGQLNIVVQSPLDPAFAAFQWDHPRPGASVLPTATSGV
jgi:hypothetical protein